MTNEESGPGRVGTPHVRAVEGDPSKVKIHVMVVTPGVGAGWHQEFRDKLRSEAPKLDLQIGGGGQGFNIDGVVPEEELETTIGLIDDAVSFATRRWEHLHKQSELDAEKYEADLAAAEKARQDALDARAAALAKPDRGIRNSRIW